VRLSALLAQIEPAAWFGLNAPKAIDALRLLIERPIVFVSIPAIIATSLSENLPRLCVVWLIFAVWMIVLALVGRPPLVHVYYSPLVLIFCLALIRTNEARQWISAASAMVAAAFALSFLIARHAEHAQETQRTAAAFASVDTSKLYVAWGAFPWQEAYPLFGIPTELRGLRFYGLGSTSLAPFATAQWGGQNRGLEGEFARKATFLIITQKGLIVLLAEYCARRYSRKLRYVEMRRLHFGEIYAITCE